ncbi:hypothetical protein BGZ67_007423 [Mortierella alpina]|nr:hypothetical protein BGZ67_007423 [Mortierella alpina]
MITADTRPAASSILSPSSPAPQAPSTPSARPHTLAPHPQRASGLRHYTQHHYTRSPLSTQAPYRSSNNSSSNEESPSKHRPTPPADYARPNNIMSKTIDIRHKHQQATPSSSSTYSNMTSSGSSSNTNNTASEESRRKLRYNDSFDQPEEPFECDVSAILPVKRTTGLSLLSDYEDSDVDSFNSDNEDFEIQDQVNESLAPSERRLAQQERESSHPQVKKEKTRIP